VAYRDELTAALERVRALEHELAERKRDVVSDDNTPTVLGASDVIVGAASDNPKFRELLQRRLAQQRPAVVVQENLWLKARAIPILFSASGEAGETVVVSKRPECAFRGDELFAFDTSPRPGHGTLIVHAWVGHTPQFEDVPTWMFYEWLPPEEREAYETAAKLVGTRFETAEARAAAARLRIAKAAMRLTWRTCEPALEITMRVLFRETCRWEAVLWGLGLG
jgi:hypothetical protein